jgi:hypothetical protein
MARGLGWVVLFLSGLAWAQSDSTAGPDGTPINKSNYPSDLPSRPIVLPPGMLGIDGRFEGDNASGAWDYTGRVGVTYGFASGWNASIAAQADKDGLNDAELALSYLWSGNLAASIGAGACSAAPCTTSTWSLDAFAGLPIKLKPWSLPLSLRALDRVIDVYVPFSSSSSSDGGVKAQVGIPVSAQFSFLPILSAEASVLTILPYGTSKNEVVFWPRGALIFTTRSFDLGVDVRYSLPAGSSPTTIPNVFTAGAFLQLRL